MKGHLFPWRFIKPILLQHKLTIRYRSLGTDISLYCPLTILYLYAIAEQWSCFIVLECPREGESYTCGAG